MNSQRQNQLQAHTAVIRPLRPLVYNFFVSERPECNQQTLEATYNPSYRSYHSQKIDQNKSHFFRPTINCKKMIEEPKFKLSVDRKKKKVIESLGKKANSERPSRSSYRGSKVRNVTHRSVANQQQLQINDQLIKQKKIQSQELSLTVAPKKTKQPHLHFNLNHLIKTRKTFNSEFSRQQNIQGSNFAYYNFFSSQKSSMPKSQHSVRNKHYKAIQKHRYISTTVAVRSYHQNI